MYGSRYIIFGLTKTLYVSVMAGTLCSSDTKYIRFDEIGHKAYPSPLQGNTY